MKHAVTFRVYYEDTDAGGVMYHANYLNFCERGRTEFLHALGYTNASLHAETGMIMVVRHIDAHYMKPCYLEDQLTVRSVVTDIGNASFTMRQEIYRDGADTKADNPAFSMDIVLVCVGKNAKAVRMSADVKKAMGQFLESK